jgi:hypothetical protein
VRQALSKEVFSGGATADVADAYRQDPFEHSVNSLPGLVRSTPSNTFRQLTAALSEEITVPLSLSQAAGYAHGQAMAQESALAKPTGTATAPPIGKLRALSKETGLLPCLSITRRYRQ